MENQFLEWIDKCIELRSQMDALQYLPYGEDGEHYHCLTAMPEEHMEWQEGDSKYTYHKALHVDYNTLCTLAQILHMTLMVDGKRMENPNEPYNAYGIWYKNHYVFALLHKKEDTIESNYVEPVGK